jgi:ABC-type multidrug transport system permease subunit
MAVFTLARKDLRVLLRDTRAAIILLTMPLIFIVVLGLALGDPDERLRVTIVDEDAGLPPDPGPFPDRKWSEIVRQDLEETGGINVEVVASRAEAEGMVRRGKRSAILVFTPEFSAKVHNCSFLDDKFLGGKSGVNPFYRDGVDVKMLGLDILEDPKQVLAASIIKQVAQVSLLRVVMPWMIGKAFDKITDKQFIDEMAERVEITPSLAAPVRRPLKQLNDKQRVEVGIGVQKSLQQMLNKYNLQAKTWADLTLDRSGPHAEAAPPAGGRAERFQELVPAAVVMFAFLLVLNVGWLFVSERRQGTLLRLRAAPLLRAEILFGKILPCYAVSLGQGFFLLLAGRVLFGMKWGPCPWLLPLVVAATSTAAVGLAVLVASVAKTESQVSIYGSLLMLVLGGLSGCLMPRAWMPEKLQAIRQFTPHAWALDAYQELLLPNPDLANVFAACGVLAAFGVVFTALTWWLMKLD